MSSVRILVWNLDSGTHLSDAVISLLEGAGRAVEVLRHDGFCADALAKPVQERDLQAGFVVFSGRPLGPAAREVLREFAASRPSLPLFAVTASEDPEALLALLRLGVTDFLRPPLRPCEVLPRLWRSLERLQPPAEPLQELTKVRMIGKLIGQSPAFLAEVAKLPLLARCEVSVLICGETGTGKELFARAIHYLSPRAKKPFVPVNCGAVPTELMENELFGHERGAFTGAGGVHPGLVERAEGGTLFLDEVESLSLAAQVKLLRFLQDKEYRRLGSTRLATSDLRMIAASNAAIKDAVDRGELRRDFYYRLNVVPICLPPLREREEDIPLLAEHFLRRYTKRFGRQIDGFTREMMAALLRYDWPGNVRELEHVVERAVVLAGDRRCVGCREALFPTECSEPTLRELSFKEAKAKVVASFERRYVESKLAESRGNISRAARAAKKDRRSFFELIRKHRIDAGRFRSRPLPGRGVIRSARSGAGTAGHQELR